MVKLSKRLKKICDLASSYKRIADIGCDHGKVLGYLAENYLPELLIASDISEPSVRKADLLLQKINYKNYDVRIGNGLENIFETDKLDLIIIAGMGGLEIIEILSNKKINCNYILAPQNNEYKLRVYLNNNNFQIINDYIVFDKGKFYVIIEVRVGSQTLNEFQLKYGINYNVFDQDWLKYLKYNQSIIKQRLNNIKNEKLKSFQEKNLKEIELIIKTIQKE